MDSTQFDYKNSNNDGLRAGYPRANSKGQRPTSAQSQKYGQNNLGAQYYDSSALSNPTHQNNNSFNQNRRPNTGAGGSRHNGPFNSDISRNPAENVIEELEGEEEARLVERATYNQPLQLQQLPDVQKLMPKYISLEKEKLYEDTLHLKQHINALREENLKLKTRNLNLERDNAKLGKVVERGGNPGIQYGKQPESALIVALKKQVKESKEELKIRVDELENMKRNTKFTRVQELEIELKAFIDENLRLKTLYEDLQNLKPQINPEDYTALEERCYLQNNLIESLQRDHERLSGEIRYLQQENYSLQTALDVEVKATLKQKAEVVKAKKQLYTKDKELKNWQQYKLEIAPGNTSANKGSGKPLLNDSHHNTSTVGQNSPGKGGKAVKSKAGSAGGAPPETEDLAQLIAELAELKEQNKQLIFKYETMGGRHVQADNKTLMEAINRQPDASKDKNTIRSDQAKLRRQNKILELEYNSLMETQTAQPQNHNQAPKISVTGSGQKPVEQLQQQRPESKEQKSDTREQKSELKDYMPEPKVEQKPKTEVVPQLRPDRPESAKHEGRPRSAVKEVKEVKETKAKLPLVKFDEVKQIVRGLVLSLKFKRVPSGKALASLPKEGQMKLSDVKKDLQQLGIKDESEALLVARYIYQTEKEPVELDLNKVQDVSSIRGQLSELLDEYVLASEAQEEAAKKELCEILYRYEQSIDTQFSILDDDCNGHLPESLIIEAFTKLEIKLSQGALEHLIGRLYEDSGSLKKLNYERLFEIFENDIQKYSKQNTSKPTSQVQSAAQADKKPAAVVAPPEDEDYEEEYGDDDQEVEDYNDEYENDEDQD